MRKIESNRYLNINFIIVRTINILETKDINLLLHIKTHKSKRYIRWYMIRKKYQIQTKSYYLNLKQL